MGSFLDPFKISSSLEVAGTRHKPGGKDIAEYVTKQQALDTEEKAAWRKYKQTSRWRICKQNQSRKAEEQMSSR